MKRPRYFTEKRKKQYLGVLVAVLVIIAILGYAFEQKKEPIRVTFDTQGGGVIFDHRLHTSLENAQCQGCHHNSAGGESETAAMNCRECHYSEKYGQACVDNPIHKRCIAKNCDACHVTGSVTCTFCHNAENFAPVQEPKTVEFETSIGRVVFDHSAHASADGIGLECDTCHHGYSAGKKNSFPMNCRRCHYNKQYKGLCENEETHTVCIGKNCMDCHSDGAENCEICHKE